MKQLQHIHVHLHVQINLQWSKTAHKVDILINKHTCLKQMALIFDFKYHKSGNFCLYLILGCMTLCKIKIYLLQIP